MHEKDSDAEYLKRYKSMLRGFAEMAASDPDIVGQLKDVLKISATAMISNRPDSVSEFQRLAEEVDSFLSACQTGEVDPHSFVQSFDDQYS